MLDRLASTGRPEWRDGGSGLSPGDEDPFELMKGQVRCGRLRFVTLSLGVALEPSRQELSTFIQDDGRAGAEGDDSGPIKQSSR